MVVVSSTLLFNTRATPMAKKRPQPRKKPSNQVGPSRPKSELPTELPDRRALERSLKGLTRHLSGGGGVETPLDRAQDIMYDAFGERDPGMRVKLAKRALEISPDCADAYVLLAEHARSRKEALEYFEKGVAAGERALGPEAFQEHAGHFWGVLETRPYMRAREGLACELWTMARGDEAIEHLQEMLRLNPNDNQGVRYTLVSFLLNLNRDEEVARLLDQYNDDAMANWAYSKALHAFRRQGDTPEARQLLETAHKRNAIRTGILAGRGAGPDREAGLSWAGGSE